MSERILITGGHLVDPAAGVDAPMDILIEDGAISAVTAPGTAGEADRHIAADGMTVVPGLIDTHAHLREPGFEYKETIADAGRAAVSAGITTLFAMPNTNPVCDTVAVCEQVTARAAEAKLARVLPVGALTRDMAGEVLSEMGELAGFGCPAVSDAWVPVDSSQMMRRALEYAKGVGIRVITVPQDLGLSKGGVMHEGTMSTRLGLTGIPAASEDIPVARAIALSELTGCPIHISPISTSGAARMVKNARARGVPVTCGTAPHYLLLTDTAVDGYDTAAKVYPPLRTGADRDALREALADGTIDTITSCHAPHAPHEKAVEFDQAPFGIAGLSTALSLTLKLVDEKVMSFSDAIARWTAGPKAAFALSDTGTLEKGAAADLVILDRSSGWTITGEDAGRAGITPFAGMTVPGRVVRTLVAGRTVYEAAEPAESGTAAAVGGTR